MYLIGNGFDCHKIVYTKKDDLINYLAFGGIKIYDNNKRFEAHSDGDVIIHAIIDSILSPTVNEDIGVFFPDNDERYKNLNSVQMLKQVLNFIYYNISNKNAINLIKNKFVLTKDNNHEKKFKIINIDITVVCDQINVSKYKKNIIENLNNLIPDTYVSIKGKTTENGLNTDYCYVWVSSLIEKL